MYLKLNVVSEVGWVGVTLTDQSGKKGQDILPESSRTNMTLGSTKVEEEVTSGDVAISVTAPRATTANPNKASANAALLDNFRSIIANPCMDTL